MKKLTHKNLVELGQLLGYPLIKDGGLCHGFSCMLMQAILAQEEPQFWQRLKLIEAYDDFPSLKNAIEGVKLKVKDNQEALSLTDMELLEIPILYEGVELYLQPMTHADVLNKNKSFDDDIYRLAHPVKLEGDTISLPLDKEYAGNKDNLKNYINNLEVILFKHPNLPILVESINHSVLLKYNSNNTKQSWLYVDTNDFQKYPNDANYYRELNSTELVDSLFNSLNPESEYIVFNMAVVAGSTHPVNEDKSLQQFQVTNKLNKEHATIYDQRGAGLLLIACKNGHAEAVKLLLAQDGIEINKENSDGETPLFMACFYGHAEAVKLLLAHPGIDINIASSKGTTPLVMACQKGHVEAVKLLLAHPGIEINKASPDGFTPLHIACRSLATLENKMLFDVLLNNKADPALKNSEGKTALDIAFSHQNNAAIEALVLFAKDKPLSLTSLMSPETQNIALEWARDKASKPHNNGFFASASFSNSKDFIQQELKDTEVHCPKKM